MPPHSAVGAQMTFFLYILQRYPANKEWRISYTEETLHLIRIKARYPKRPKRRKTIKLCATKVTIDAQFTYVLHHCITQ
jgi:hypothetical protein